MHYRNEGARFTTGDGRTVGTGDVFEADPHDPVVRRRRHKLTPVSGAQSPSDLDIEFGSEPARELAEAEGLTRADFEGVEPSGASGYVLGDVRRLL